MRSPLLVLFTACLAAGCGEPASPPASPYPRDDVLALQHVQALGTHNSYHVAPHDMPVVDWSYSHDPLDVQLEEQGVRQFELDLWWVDGELLVHHDPLFDDGTTCPTFGACLEVIGAWSAEHPQHQPLFVLVELKLPWWEETAAEILEAVDATVRDSWPDGGVITPGEVRGGHDSLQEALAAGGWPTLGSLRGRLLLTLLSGGQYLEEHLARGTPLLFPNARGDLTVPHAAVHTIDDPVGRREEVTAAAVAGHLVRTRADSGGEEARAGDTSRLQAALDGGAHFVTTDYPAARDGLDYVVRIPDGTPSRCNPVSAPPGCSPADIEAPDELR